MLGLVRLDHISSDVIRL